MRVFLLFGILFTHSVLCSGQSITARLSKALQILESDSQLKHAITGFCVADAKTGKLIFQRNSQVGLAPASTQKIFTSVAFFEIAGSSYRYTTEFGYAGTLQNQQPDGGLYCLGSGDPSLGSWRYPTTRPDFIFNNLADSIRKAGIRSPGLSMKIIEAPFDPLPVPGGWIMDDVGNYYGAGTWSVNWKENQYDIELASDLSVGTPVTVKRNQALAYTKESFENYLVSGEKGSGDNAYIYLPTDRQPYLLKGTIPSGERSFVISGAVTSGPEYLLSDWYSFLEKKGITLQAVPTEMSGEKLPLYKYQSPAFDTLNYYFLRKSINLYGEAFLKTLGLIKKGMGSTEKGLEVLQEFYQSKGFDTDALNLLDGSGLSPQNRVTVAEQVKLLLYARSRPWFMSFYHALPEYNGMKMKSGSIGGARAFAGYHRAAGGQEYVFSIIVNNFQGSAGQVVKKIYSLLDVLK